MVLKWIENQDSKVADGKNITSHVYYKWAIFIQVLYSIQMVTQLDSYGILSRLNISF